MFVEIFILIMNISISTAHNVDIDYIPAGVLDRILATLIDGAFQFGLLMLGLMFIGLFSMVASPTWFFVILAVIIASYHLFCEAVFNGRSPWQIHHAYPSRETKRQKTHFLGLYAPLGLPLNRYFHLKRCHRRHLDHRLQTNAKTR